MKQKQTLGLNPHDFRFNRDTRRMVCHRCGGVMGECEHTCKGAVYNLKSFSSGVERPKSPTEELLERVCPAMQEYPDPFDQMEPTDG